MRTLILFLCFSLPLLGVWSNGYTYRATITIDNTKVSGSGDLSNFPVLISDTYDGTGGEPDLRDIGNGGDVQSASGWDIRFETTGGGQLDHEIELYTDSTGVVVIWVEVDTVDHDDDTLIYMYYGKAGLGASEEDENGTWDGGSYVGVWHLDEVAVDEQQVATHDDSHNGNDGTQDGNESTASGAINGAQTMDGGDDFIEVTDDNSLDLSTFTISAWLRATSFGGGAFGFEMVIDKRLADESIFNYALGFDSGKPLFAYKESGEAVQVHTDNAALNTATWYYLTWTYDGSDVEIYVNDTEVYTAGETDTLDATNESLKFGDRQQAGQAFDGILDEIRISTGLLSAAWVVTEYNNQGTPGTFYSMGAPVTLGRPYAPIVMD